MISKLRYEVYSGVLVSAQTNTYITVSAFTCIIDGKELI